MSSHQTPQHTSNALVPPLQNASMPENQRPVSAGAPPSTQEIDFEMDENEYFDFSQYNSENQQQQQGASLIQNQATPHPHHPIHHQVQQLQSSQPSPMHQQSQPSSIHQQAQQLQHSKMPSKQLLQPPAAPRQTPLVMQQQQQVRHQYQVTKISRPHDEKKEATKVHQVDHPVKLPSQAGVPFVGNPLLYPYPHPMIPGVVPPLAPPPVIPHGANPAAAAVAAAAATAGPYLQFLTHTLNNFYAAAALGSQSPAALLSPNISPMLANSLMQSPLMHQLPASQLPPLLANHSAVRSPAKLPLATLNPPVPKKVSVPAASPKSAPVHPPPLASPKAQNSTIAPLPPSASPRAQNSSIVLPAQNNAMTLPAQAPQVQNSVVPPAPPLPPQYLFHHAAMPHVPYVFQTHAQQNNKATPPPAPKPTPKLPPPTPKLLEPSISVTSNTSDAVDEPQQERDEAKQINKLEPKEDSMQEDKEDSAANPSVSSDNMNDSGNTGDDSAMGSPLSPADGFDMDRDGRKGRRGGRSGKPRAKTCQRWTEEQNRALREAVLKYGPRNWKKIAEEIGNVFTADQCNQHWHRVLNPRIIKGDWTPQEDELLYERVASFGESSWTKIAEGIPGRTDIQCRHRYFQKKKEFQTQMKMNSPPSAQDMLGNKNGTSNGSTRSPLKRPDFQFGVNTKFLETSCDSSHFSYFESNFSDGEDELLDNVPLDEQSAKEEKTSQGELDLTTNEDISIPTNAQFTASQQPTTLPHTVPSVSSASLLNNLVNTALCEGDQDEKMTSDLEDEEDHQLQDEVENIETVRQSIKYLKVRMEEDPLKPGEICVNIVPVVPFIETIPIVTSRRRKSSRGGKIVTGTRAPISMNRMRGSLNVQVPWSEAEEKMLLKGVGKCKENQPPELQGEIAFADILTQNSSSFHPLRTPALLQKRYEQILLGKPDELNQQEELDSLAGEHTREGLLSNVEKEKKRRKIKGGKKRKDGKPAHNPATNALFAALELLGMEEDSRKGTEGLMSLSQAAVNDEPNENALNEAKNRVNGDDEYEPVRVSRRGRGARKPAADESLRRSKRIKDKKIDVKSMLDQDDALFEEEQLEEHAARANCTEDVNAAAQEVDNYADDTYDLDEDDEEVYVGAVISDIIPDSSIPPSQPIPSVATTLSATTTIITQRKVTVNLQLENVKRKIGDVLITIDESPNKRKKKLTNEEGNANGSGGEQLANSASSSGDNNHSQPELEIGQQAPLSAVTVTNGKDMISFIVEMDENEDSRKTGLYELPNPIVHMSRNSTVQELVDEISSKLEIRQSIKLEILHDKKVLPTQTTLDQIIIAHEINPENLVLHYRSRGTGGR